MGSVNFYLLDSPRLEQDGKLVQVDTRKAIALLAYLAVTGKQHGRDTLAALLWPDYSQSNARAALRRTLSALHHALGWQIVEASREVLALPERSALWVDVIEFYGCLQQTGAHGHPTGQVCPQCISYLEKAVKLYRSHFMSGFTLRDSIEFDDWQFMQSESLRRELASALERLVLAYTADKRYEDAIGCAQRWLSLDSLHEPAHRQLMQLYAVAGKRSAALRQYQECVRILDKELGVPPLEETSRLYQDIKERRSVWAGERPDAAGFSTIQLAGQFAGTVSAPSTGSPVSEQGSLAAQASRLPMVGRQTEWEVFQGAYSLSKGGGFFLAVEGEAGMGKTRLAEEFISFARSHGAAALQARCYPDEANLAYAPFVDALSSAIDQPAQEDWYRSLAQHWLSEAARLLPNISKLPLDLPPAPSPENPGAQTRFFEGVSQVILALCGSAEPGDSPPGILFLDDLEWADEATLDLLTYLVRRLKGHPLLVLAAWRGENLESGHRLRALLAEAQRRGRGELLMLSPLTKEAVKELVVAAVEGAAVTEDSFSQRLYQETEGLPFFITEYLTILPDVIAAETSNGRESEAWPIPHGVRDLLHSRMEQTGETGIQLLQTAAVIGRSFDFDTLHAASGRTEDEAVSTLEELIARGLIRESQPGAGGFLEPLRSLTYDFSHEKLRSLVYNETSLARRRLLHVRTADVLLSRFRSRQDFAPLAGQIAFHYKQGGKAREAAEYYRLAGDYARGLYANSEALAHYQAALSLGYPDPSGLNEDIGGMYTLLGNYSAAIASYELALAQLERDAPGIARLAHKLGNIYQRLGEWEQAESYFQASTESLAVEGEPAALARLYADWSLTLHQRGQLERAGEMARKALELAEQAGDTLALAQAYNILGILARSQGKLPEAIGHLERSLDLAESMQELSARIAALNNLSLAHADSHNLEQAIAYARRALEYCLQLGDRHREAALQNNLADLYHAAGDEEQAMVHLKQAVAIFSEVGGEQYGQGSRPLYPEIWKLTEW